MNIFLPDKILLPENILSGHAIAIEGDTISRIAPAEDLPQKGHAIHRLEHKIIVPGTVNAHNHSFQSLLRGFVDDYSFFQWRDEGIYKYSTHLSTEDIYVGALFAFSEMIHNGITSVADFFYIHDHSNENCRAVIEAARKVGIRFVLCRCMMDWNKSPDIFKETPEEAADRCEELIDECSDDEMVNVFPAPHSLHAASPEMIKKGYMVAEKKDTLCHIHVAEGKYEVEGLKQKHAKTPVRYLESLGVLGESLACVHAVWVDEEEINLLSKSETKIIHCPSSNLFLGDGIAKIKEMVEAGICVSLGTDGACSNNQLNIFGEMRLAALLQKGKNYDSTVTKAKQYFDMGTVNGAIALGVKAGTLKEGYKADFVALNMQELSLHPIQNLRNNIVYAMSPTAVTDVVVGGRVVLENQKLLTVNESDIFTSVEKIIEGWQGKGLCVNQPFRHG